MPELEPAAPLDVEDAPAPAVPEVLPAAPLPPLPIWALMRTNPPPEPPDADEELLPLPAVEDDPLPVVPVAPPPLCRQPVIVTCCPAPPPLDCPRVEPLCEPPDCALTPDARAAQTIVPNMMCRFIRFSTF